MQPQNTSWCAIHRVVERLRMNDWATRFDATRPGRATALAPRLPFLRNDCHPRRLSIRVGGRFNHTRYR